MTIRTNSVGNENNFDNIVLKSLDTKLKKTDFSIFFNTDIENYLSEDVYDGICITTHKEEEIEPDEEFKKAYAELSVRLEKLNTKTALHRNENDNQRFGPDGIKTILAYAIDMDSIDIINKQLDALENGANIWTCTIVEIFKSQVHDKTQIAQDIVDVFGKETSRRSGRLIIPPNIERKADKELSDSQKLIDKNTHDTTSQIEKEYTELSTHPEVIAYEQKMKEMGYEVTFADNLEAAKLITEVYEELTNKGFRLPKKVILMSPTQKGMLGFRPYATDEKKYDTPIYFSIDVTKKVKNEYFLPGIKYNSTDTPQGVIYHEIGHFLHEETDLDDGEAIRLWKELTNDGNDIELAKEVGYYGMTGDKFHRGKEFVAEVFAGLMCGKTYSKRVMDIYYALGGPKVPN